MLCFSLPILILAVNFQVDGLYINPDFISERKLPELMGPQQPQAELTVHDLKKYSVIGEINKLKSLPGSRDNFDEVAEDGPGTAGAMRLLVGPSRTGVLLGGADMVLIAHALLLDHVYERCYVLLGGGDIGLDPIELLLLHVVLLVAPHKLAPQLLDRVVVLGLGVALALPQRLDPRGQHSQHLLLRH